MDFEKEFLTACREIRKRRPVIHHITNKVTIQDVANMTLAIGASPIMADSAEESADMAKVADALVLNIGTPDTGIVESIRRASRAAREKGIPIILDPVAVGATMFRGRIVDKILADGVVNVIRGNASEIRTIAGQKAVQKGADTGDDMNGMDGVAEELSRKTGAIIAVTGPVDYITDGQTTYHLKNGHSMLSNVTGAGCMSNALVAAFTARLGVNVKAVAMGILMMGLAGEWAYKSLQPGDGIGMFHTRLFDGVWILSQSLTMEEVSLNVESVSLSCDKTY